MRTFRVLGAVLVSLSVASPVGAAPPWDPSVPAPRADHAADCDGITITTVNWPDGSYGTLGINGDPPYSIPMNTTAHWSTSGTYTFTMFFSVPDQVPGSEYEHVECGDPALVAVESQAVVEAELPATL